VRYLLDAHTLIWSQDDTSKVSAAATAALTGPAHDRLLSIVTAWEIGIKVALGKLTLLKPFRVWVQTAITDLVLTELPIALKHVEQQMSLPFHHRDPFDRLLGQSSLIPARGGGAVSPTRQRGQAKPTRQRGQAKPTRQRGRIRHDGDCLLFDLDHLRHLAAR